MEFSFDRTAHLQERLAFIRQYAAWVKRMPDADWSRQQADLIDNFIENARNIPLSKEAYLRIVDRQKRNIPRIGFFLRSAKPVWTGSRTSLSSAMKKSHQRS